MDIDSMIDILEKIDKEDLGGLERFLRSHKTMERAAVKEGK